MDTYIKVTREDLNKLPKNKMVQFVSDENIKDILLVSIRENNMITCGYIVKDNYDADEIPEYDVKIIDEDELNRILQNYKANVFSVEKDKELYAKELSENSSKYVITENEELESIERIIKNLNTNLKYDLDYEDSSSKEGYAYNALLNWLYKMAEDSDINFILEAYDGNPFNISDVKDMFMEDYNLTYAVIKMLNFAKFCGIRKVARELENTDFEKHLFE